MPFPQEDGFKINWEFSSPPPLPVLRITRMLIEQDGPGWREKLPEIPVVPLAVQQQHREKPVSAEVAEARAARAAQEEGRPRFFCFFLLV